MNIVEAYTKYNKGLVIFISGISGCGKTSISKKISRELNLNMIEQFEYYKEGYDTKITLPDNTEHINYYNDEAFDWDRFNKDIKNKMIKGVIVTGYALIKDKIKIKPDIHIHLSMSKQACIEKRRKYLEKNKDRFKEEFETIDTPTEKLKMNMMIFPYYIDAKNRSDIDKYVNTTEMSSDDVINNVWSTIFLDVITQPKIEELYWKLNNKKKEPVEDTPEQDTLNNSTMYTPEESQSVNTPEETPEETPGETSEETPTEHTYEGTGDLDEDYEQSQEIHDGPIEFEGLDTLTMDTDTESN